MALALKLYRDVLKTMGQALPKPALRPFLPADVPVLAAIFTASIEELTGDDYNEAQQQAWTAAAEDEESSASGSRPN